MTSANSRSKHSEHLVAEGEGRSAVVISATSDIGAALALRWASRGWSVFGTYRTRSPAVDHLQDRGVRLVCCDLDDISSIRDACTELHRLCPGWDVLVLCPATQEPVGPFVECDFEQWDQSIRVNFTNQMRVVHELLPNRRLGTPLGPCVLLFAGGGGANSAPANYSAYVVSKIALTKMCELLDAEVPDTRFVIAGPGFMPTKIHAATLRAGERAGANYRRTMERLATDDGTPMEQVMDCLDWLADSPRQVVGGRNFSVVFDRWGSTELTERLLAEPNMYKLRRLGNEWLVAR